MPRFKFSAVVCTTIQVAFLTLAAAAFPVRAQNDLLWNALEPANTVYLQLQDGLVVIELNPVFAPKTVKQFKRLLADQFYRGLSFYRDIDGFVAQGGDDGDLGDAHAVPAFKAEFEIDWPQKP